MSDTGNTLGTFLAGLTMIVGIPGYFAFKAWVEGQEIATCRQTYADRLDELRSEPASPTRYAAALEAGRRYASACRDSGKVAIFDEMALQNDLMAATVAAHRAPAPPAPQQAASPPTTASVEQRLSELAALRDKGLLDDATFEKKRSAILDSL